MGETTVEGNVLEIRVGACDLEESCLEWAGVELSPVEVPPGGRLGQLVDARKGVLDNPDRRLRVVCRGTQKNLRANS